MIAPLGHNHLARTQWAGRINGIWRRLGKGSVEGYRDLGVELIAAKLDLIRNGPSGEWQAMVQEDLEFHPRVARMFMAIGKWIVPKTEAMPPLVELLPPDYTTVCLLARLDKIRPELFDELVENGTINPSLQRNEISALLRRQRVEADEARILNLAPIIGKFRTLVIDPAWEYDWLSLAGRAKPGYAMETIEQLRDRDVAAWADDQVGCHLYCWVTNNFMAEACKLVAHWGFQHRTILTWIKPPPFGLGSYFRNSTEHVIFATRGKTTTRPAAASISTHFEAERGEHSEKPEKFYEIVRAASYPPYGEANQREPRPDFVNLFEERDTGSREAAE